MQETKIKIKNNHQFFFIFVSEMADLGDVDLAPKTHKGVCVPVCLNSLSNAVFIIITSQSLETTNISTSVQYYRTFFF